MASVIDGLEFVVRQELAVTKDLSTPASSEIEGVSFFLPWASQKMAEIFLECEQNPVFLQTRIDWIESDNCQVRRVTGGK